MTILNFDVHKAKDRLWICVQGHSLEDPPLFEILTHILFSSTLCTHDLFVRTRAFLTLSLWLGRGARSGGERPGLKKTNGRQIWAGRFLCALPITEHPRTTRGNAGTWREEKEEEEEGGCVALNGFPRLNLSRERVRSEYVWDARLIHALTSTNISAPGIVDINNARSDRRSDRCNNRAGRRRRFVRSNEDRSRCRR